jgi:competence ComEA-like helix-hairpin-helix protein
LPLLPTRATPLPQVEQIQVYTNHEPSATYTEPYRQQTRSGADLEQIIVETIAAARSSVDVAVQEFRLPKIAAALAAKQQAGVKVRVILENTYSRPLSGFTPAELDQLPDREANRFAEFQQLVDRDRDGHLSPVEIQQGDALVMLDQAGVPRIDDTADGSAGSNLMHHKFVVVDRQTVLVTSANFTTSDVHGDFKSPSSRGNANNLLKITSPNLAALFTQEFNFMWGDGVGKKPDSKFGTKKPFRPTQTVMVGSTPIQVQFSPSASAVPWTESTNGLISKTLQSAKRSIAFALFVLSDQVLVNSLESLPQAGIAIQGLIDPGFAYRSYSEALDMLGVALADNCKFEPNNRPWKSPLQTIGVPRLPPGDLLHNKFGLVDQSIVITGSHNWTDAANRGNDETLLVIQNPIVAAHFQREFDRLYTNAILGVPPAIQRKVQQATQCPVAPRPPLIQATQLPVWMSHSRSQPPSSQAIVNRRVNLNTATQAELEALPGVGAKLAQRIIAARQAKPFTSLADLDQVPGISSKLLQKLKSQVSW